MIEDNELINDLWVSDNLTSIIFTQKEMDKLMDSFLDENGLPSNKMKDGFGYWKRKLKTPRTRSEIVTATPEQLKEWLVPLG